MSKNHDWFKTLLVSVCNVLNTRYNVGHFAKVFELELFVRFSLYAMKVTNWASFVLKMTTSGLHRSLVFCMCFTMFYVRDKAGMQDLGLLLRLLSWGLNFQ